MTYYFTTYYFTPYYFTTYYFTTYYFTTYYFTTYYFTPYYLLLTPYTIELFFTNSIISFTYPKAIPTTVSAAP